MGIEVVNSELLCTSAHFMLNLKLFAGRDRTTQSRTKKEKTLQRIARKYCRCEVLLSNDAISNHEHVLKSYPLTRRAS